jgi:orotate phosphoribosyltransferase
VILVLAVVDREEGAAEFFAEQGLKFDSLFKAGAFLAG